jgi:hypothetical protein
VLTRSAIAQGLVVRFEHGLRGREEIEAMTLELVRVILPRFERRL